MKELHPTLKRLSSALGSTPILQWQGCWDELRNHKPWIGEWGRHSLRKYVAREHRMLDFDLGSMSLPEIVKLLESDALACRSLAAADVRTSVAAKTADGEQQPPDIPKVYLSGWREILDTLSLDNNATNQRRVRNAHDSFPGPIIMPPKGGQPKVVKADLLAWWNGLEDRYREDATVRASLLVDRTATVENQFDLGRGGHEETIVPEIAGRVKRRRGSA